MSQHSTLTLERWRGFDKAQQILMIGNEMNRGKRLSEPLRLTDLTAQAADRHAFRREILRWRDGIAELYLAAEPDPNRHRQLFKHLLLMTPESARQRPFVLK